MNTRRRVVVTGLGAVTPLGNDVDSLWRGCLEGRSGVRAITAFDASALPCRIAGEAWGFEPRDYFSEKESRRFPRFTQFAIVATQEALQQSGLEPQAWDERERSHAGIILGNGSGGMSWVREQVLVHEEKGWAYCDPLGLLKTLPDMASAVLCSRFGFTGYNATMAASCASGTAAIGQALDMIRAGRAEIIVAGGTEAWITELGIGSFALLRALTSRNDEPERASRPFDRERDGFVPAEGAAMLVLESEGHARERGAEIIGEVKGYASTADAHHLVAPRPDGACAARSIQLAMEDAGAAPVDIDYINAHGTSTALNDVAETRAIAQALGEAAARIPASATKSLLGHSLGASGAIEAVVTLKSIQEGRVHPTINLDDPDPRCQVSHVRDQAMETPVRNALSLNFAFGGQNASLVLGKYE